MKIIKIKRNTKYLYAFFLLFAAEALIALFVHDRFIRPYVGDVLVVVLLYCLIRAFLPYEGRLLPLVIFLFAALVEVGQYFDLVGLLGLGESRIARLLIGSTFDRKDLLCYLLGCTGLFLFECWQRRTPNA